jgi:hypothetical protein
MATNQMTAIRNGLSKNESSGKWYANIRFRGKLFRHSLETTDKTEARNKLADFRRELEKGSVRNEENTTVSEAAPRFLASISGMSHSSQVRAKGHINVFVEEFGDRNPRELKPMDLSEWLQELRDEQDFGEDNPGRNRDTRVA